MSTTSYSFNCTKCNVHFEVKGHWYNQMLMKWWLDYKWLWHCVFHHHDKWNKHDLRYLFMIHLCFIPLLILQILDIIAAPFRLL